MEDAIKKYVKNGSTVYIGGLVSHVCFAAVHEIIRQQKKNLTLIHPCIDLSGDLLIGNGCVKKVITSFCSDEFFGQCHAFRRAIEQKYPRKIEIEDHSMGSLVFRLKAGALHIPFIPIRSVIGSDIERVTPKNIKKITWVKDPFNNELTPVVKAIHPDVAIVHTQTCDYDGNAQLSGVVETILDGVDSSKKVIITTEKIRNLKRKSWNSNLTFIPDFIVDAIVEEPWACHPTYLPNYYKIDDEHRFMYHKMAREPQGFNEYTSEWITGVNNRDEYLKKIGKKQLRLLNLGLAVV